MHLERKLVFSSLVLFLILIGASLIIGKGPSVLFDTDGESLATDTLTLGASEIKIVVSRDEVSRSKGLGGVETLAPDTGMLFIFENTDIWGIWMKDMKISIDVLWLDDMGRIVSVEENMSPETYPKIFFPTNRSRYVLEVPTGTFKTSGALRGSVIDLSRISN
jgi:uncharacterized membrane protein (UPF0127 family)